MSWKNNLQVYLDPSLKTMHRDLFLKIESEFSRVGMQLLSGVEGLKKINIPIIFFITGQSPVEIQPFLKDPSHYVIKIEDSNLSMFQSNQESPQSVYLLSDPSEVVGLLDDLLFMIRQHLVFTMNKMVAESAKTLKNIFSRKNIEQLAESSVWGEVEQFEKQLYSFSQISEIKNYFNSEQSFLNKYEIKLLNLSELLTAENSQTQEYLTVAISADDYLFMTWNGAHKYDVVMVVYAIVNEVLHNQELVQDSKRLKKRWEKILTLIPIPLVVFDQDGDVMIHNGEFANLDLSFKDCLSIQHKEQLTIKNGLYRVLKREINRRLIEYLFVPVDDFLIETKSTSSEELGIISSSIAHEINNPLAGILAAIDYLLIDDISENIKNELVEMKQGINRCKKLINTFLGFSRLQNHGSNTIERFELAECLEQSMELMRFRLIENNLQLQFDHRILEKYAFLINPHVFSMLIYLILGDIVTNISHHSLVIRKSHHPIKLKIKENAELLELILPEEIKLSDDFLNSKLVKHLLEVVSMRMKTDQGVLTLNHF